MLVYDRDVTQSLHYFYYYSITIILLRSLNFNDYDAEFALKFSV